MASCVAVQSLCAGGAFAQTADDFDRRTPSDEIIVTARKIAEPLREAPLSVTSISARTIEAAGLDDVADLAGYAPNVDVGGGIAAQLQGQISIRGIATLVRNVGLETGVGIYVDGVYVGRPENFAQHLLDVSRVEIARGPQGTEFGKNTIAGVIHIYTEQPGDHFSGYVKARAGNYDLVNAEAAVGVPVTDTLTVRGAISYINQDGFYRHVSGGQDAGSSDLLTWRLTAKFTPSDELSFTLRGDGVRDRHARLLPGRKADGLSAELPGKSASSREQQPPQPAGARQ